MKVLLPLVIHLPVLVYAMSRLQKRFEISSKVFWVGFLVRVLAAWCVGWLYLFYYDANDTWMHFVEAGKLSQWIRINWQEYFRMLWVDDASLFQRAGIGVYQDRSLLFIRIISLLNLVSLNNYWVVAAYFASVSFVASCFLVDRIKNYYADLYWPAVFSFLFFPSVIFWSSGIIKETLALSGIYALSALILIFKNKRKLSVMQWLMLVFALYVAWGLKYYWTAIFLASAFSIGIYWMVESRFYWISRMRIPVWLLIFISLVLTASFLHPNFHLHRFLQVVVENHNQFLAVSNPDGIIHFNDLQESWWSVVANAPLAFASAIVRPFIWETTGTIALIASFENLLILILLLFSLQRVSSLWQAVDRPLLWAIVAYIILLGTFLALSTPNFGTLSRYRVGFLPFLIFLLLAANNSKITKWISFFRK